MIHEPATEQQRSSRDAAKWFAFGICAIAVAGAFALYLVAARNSDIGPSIVPDPLFARRTLIVHVNLALGVWFFAVLAGLFCLLPGARRFRVTPVAFWSAVAGAVAFTAAVSLRSADPLLSNYVPTLDHWLFLAGIALFGFGVALNFADARLFSGGQHSLIHPDARPPLKAAAIAYTTAMATIVAAWATQPGSLSSLAYYERLFWGGGHVLQFTNVLAMVSVWLILLSTVLKRRVMHPAISGGLAIVLLAPALAGPWLAATLAPPQYFTEMMRWGIFPAVSGFILACGWAVLRAHRRGLLRRGALRSTAFVGFATAAVMTVLGFVLGAMIRGENTLVPAHYHMSLGAVTATFMAGVLVLLEPLGAPLGGKAMRKLAIWQPLIFGAGQIMFSLGFALAGMSGAARKSYGEEQLVVSFGERLAAIGGGIAAVGGVVFIVLLLAAWRGRGKQLDS